MLDLRREHELTFWFEGICRVKWGQLTTVVQILSIVHHIPPPPHTQNTLWLDNQTTLCEYLTGLCSVVIVSAAEDNTERGPTSLLLCFLLLEHWKAKLGFCQTFCGISILICSLQDTESLRASFETWIFYKHWIWFWNQTSNCTEKVGKCTMVYNQVAKKLSAYQALWHRLTFSMSISMCFW